MICERHTAPKKRCNHQAVAFVQGQHVCRQHDPTGDPNCTHSLAPDRRCAYCGAHT